MLEQSELFERKREQEELLALIRVACQGSGRLAAVEGPAGIGKTCLLAAARAEAERAGMRVLSARGSPLERGFAFGVVRQMFEPVLAGMDEARRGELLTGAARQTVGLFGCLSQATAPGGDVSFALLHGLFWLAANLCAHGPLLLCVDDTHWCDASSLRFLAHLLPRLDGLPLLVVVALRPGEPDADQHLLDLITTDPSATLLRPAPLSAQASAQVVCAIVSPDADDAFCAACHTVTGGNPLLLRELAVVAVAEGVPPTARGTARLLKVGSQAVRRRVALRLAGLGPAVTALAGAVAILDRDANPGCAAALSRLEPSAVPRAVAELTAVEILHSQPRLGFVHPLVRAAVYDGLSDDQRVDGHTRAARLLTESGAAPERIAAHLLRVPPVGDPVVVATLRRAAEEALRQGSHEAALAYLERALAEPPAPDERAELLVQAGTVAFALDMTKAVEHLRKALASPGDPGRWATIAEMLALSLYAIGRNDEAIAAASDALEAAQAAGQADLRQQLEASLVSVTMMNPTHHPVAAERIRGVRNEARGDGVGGKMLDCVIALHDALAGATAQDTAVARARRALADRVLLAQPATRDCVIRSCYVLSAADLDEAVPVLDALLAQAHVSGSILIFSMTKAWRALAWLWRGSLAEAEADARDAVQALPMIGMDIGRPFAGAFLADALIEQGRLAEAAAALDWVAAPEPLPPGGYWSWLLDSQARLMIIQGRVEEGLQAMLDCGHRFTSHGWHNPAFIAWRSEAALALLMRGRREEARPLVAEELELAHRWNAPRALGRALRVAGLVQGGQDGLRLLGEAVAVLEPSPARLEYAKALIELGAALRRTGQRTQARQPLRRGVELAELCGATPLIQRGRTELRASGARPRRVGLSGPAALTPSERRVAELAAAGRTNRDIAQALFVTAKTVEVHLSSVYRKLGVPGRANLAKALPLPAGT